MQILGMPSDMAFCMILSSEAEESLENPGKMIESQEYIINGSTYLFDSNGAMKTGWIFNDGWYYYNKSGAKASG